MRVKCDTGFLYCKIFWHQHQEKTQVNQLNETALSHQLYLNPEGSWYSGVLMPPNKLFDLNIVLNILPLLLYIGDAYQ